jgi:1-acyl-sn-glycerol-3-phosphate acyltransferase
MVLSVACPRKLNFMAKEELFYNPLFSRLISKLGAFPVKRNSLDLSAVKEAMRRLKEGEILLLFPEGTRRKNGVSSVVRSGAGFFSVKLGVPVIPAFIRGTQIALPKGANFIRLTKISVRFGKQISIERRMPYKDIACHIMENIRHLSC